MIFLDRLDTTCHLRGKRRTYANIRAAVLAAGRFSAFDIATDKDGRMFAQLCRDPELVITTLGYPWTGVKLRERTTA